MKKEQGSSWWCNKEVQEAIKRKKNSFREICEIPSAENKNIYKRERNQIRKIVSGAMREAEQEMNGLCYKPNNLFKLVKF